MKLAKVLEKKPLRPILEDDVLETANRFADLALPGECERCPAPEVDLSGISASGFQSGGECRIPSLQFDQSLHFGEVPGFPLGLRRPAVDLAGLIVEAVRVEVVAPPAD